VPGLALVVEDDERGELVDQRAPGGHREGRDPADGDEQALAVPLAIEPQQQRPHALP
jgi:hypothetical protein